MDTKNAGDVTFRRLVHDLGYDMFEECPQVVTPSLGMHFWFQQSATPVASRTHGLGQGIDVIGNGGGIIAPPTERLDGSYLWRGTPDLTNLPVFPDELLARMKRERESATGVSRTTKSYGERLPETIAYGDRNAILMRAGYKLRWRNAYNERELCVALRELNKRCTPPLDDSEVLQMARSIANGPTRQVDPSAWLNAWIPKLRTAQEMRVATTLGDGGS